MIFATSSTRARLHDLRGRTTHCSPLSFRTVVNRHDLAVRLMKVDDVPFCGMETLVAIVLMIDGTALASVIHNLAT